MHDSHAAAQERRDVLDRLFVTLRKHPNVHDRRRADRQYDRQKVNPAIEPATSFPLVEQKVNRAIERATSFPLVEQTVDRLGTGSN